MSNATEAEQGVIRIRSQHSVEVTIDRLQGLLKQRGIVVFAHIDFSGDAARAGLQMRAEQMLIFLAPALSANLAAAVPLLEQAARPCENAR